MRPPIRASAMAVCACLAGCVSAFTRGRGEETVWEACRVLPIERKTLYEGILDTGIFPRGAGTVHAVVLPVEFPDTPGPTTADTVEKLVRRATDETAAWFELASYRQKHFESRGGRHWYRMSRPSTAYAPSGKVLDPLALAAEAVRTAAADMDLTGVTHVYVLAPPRSGIDKSKAFTNSRGNGIPVPEGEVRFGAVLGSNAYSIVPFGSYSAHDLTHETLHTLGLPDLYDITQASVVRSAAEVGG